MFSEAKARRVTQFIECLKHTKGEFHGEPFKLLPWQEKIIRDVFGTVRDDDPSMRQYNTAYIEIPKKNGKSELGAAIALNMLCNDDEWRAEVYSCASDRQQAAIVFDVAVDMVKQSPALSKRIKIIPSTKRMVYQPTGSIYQVLSSEVATKHGLNVSACIFDELHTQPTRALYDVMTQGSGDARKQPLWFLLTTAGTDRNSICWEVHQKALDIIEGRKDDPRFYPVLYGLPDDADWTDEKNWYKANALIGKSLFQRHTGGKTSFAPCCKGDEVDVQMGRCFVHVKMSRVHTELRIAFQKTAVKLVQDGLGKLCVLSGGSHIVFVAHLENYFIESFFLLTVTDFFVVVSDAAVFAFLLCVKFCESCIEQLVVRFFDGSVAVFDIQMGASRVNIFCKVGAAVMGNDTVTGHCADSSFDRRHLRFSGNLIDIPFAAAAAGFVTFVNS